MVILARDPQVKAPTRLHRAATLPAVPHMCNFFTALFDRAGASQTQPENSPVPTRLHCAATLPTAPHVCNFFTAFRKTPPTPSYTKRGRTERTRSGNSCTYVHLFCDSASTMVKPSPSPPSPVPWRSSSVVLHPVQHFSRLFVPSPPPPTPAHTDSGWTPAPQLRTCTPRSVAAPKSP